MSGVRLADLLMGLSRVGDLGFGLEVGTAVRSGVVAVRLARELNLPAADVQVAYYTALLHHVGCVGFAHETAGGFGDELAVNRAAARTDAADPSDTFRTFLPTLTRGESLPQRVRLVKATMTAGKRWGDAFTRAACEIGRDTAGRLGLPGSVRDSLFHVYDLWQLESRSGALSADRIPLPARIARASGVAVLFDSLGGPDAAAHAVRQRSGGMLDPEVATRFLAPGRDLLSGLGGRDLGALALEHEPTPHVEVSLLTAATVFGDLADVGCPMFAGHSTQVARLARAAAERLRLPAASVADAEVAGHLLDVGRVAIPSAVWERPGPLSLDQWEQVRLHPYHAERMLIASQELARLAPLVGRHHERLDGSGYFRGIPGRDQTQLARVLAAADAYQTAREPRPHRRAHSAVASERRLRAEVRTRRLDADAVEAVVSAAGHRVDASPTRAGGPLGLTPREVEVLVLVARGRSNDQIASELVISRRTAEHHVAHIYRKLGVSNRAAATLHAIDHGLLPTNG